MTNICDLERYRCADQPSGNCVVPNRSAVPSTDERFTAQRCAGYPRYPDEQKVDTSTLYTTANLPVRFEKSCRCVRFVVGGNVIVMVFFRHIQGIRCAD